MNDDLPSDPSPVAEYHDPELAQRFAAEPVPGHGPDFWDDLEAVLASEPVELRPVPMLGQAGGPAETQVVSQAVTQVDAEEPLAPIAIDQRRWGTTRRLAAAAAVLAVVGIGGVAVAMANRNSSEIISAAPASNPPSTTRSDPAVDDTEPRPTTTAPAPAPTTVPPVVSSPPTTAAVDYFADGAAVASIGSGAVVAFSPDDGAVLVLDDGPGGELGCEAAPLLALYAQDLTTGSRELASSDGAVVETGGVEVLVSPFGATPAEVGTRPVYWTDWCDGERHSTSRGVLAPDASISMVETVEIGGADDPFTTASDGLRSPDGNELLVVEPQRVQVATVDDPTSARTLPAKGSTGEASYRRGTWAPNGETVAVASDRGVVLWSPATGQQKVLDAADVVNVVFDNRGYRLAVVSANEVGFTTNILTFGGLPDPVPAADRCSGQVDLEPLTSRTLVAAGVPMEVAATAVAIDRAAAACDWGALAGLTDAGFTASFGGSDPVAFWQTGEAGGDSPMWVLRELLRQPFGVVDGDDGPSRYVWPSTYLRDDCDYRSERATLEALGYDPDEATRTCEEIGGYVGYRTGIDADGGWRFFVAGD